MIPDKFQPYNILALQQAENPLPAASSQLEVFELHKPETPCSSLLKEIEKMHELAETLMKKNNSSESDNGVLYESSQILAQIIEQINKCEPSKHSLALLKSDPLSDSLEPPVKSLTQDPFEFNTLYFCRDKSKTLQAVATTRLQKLARSGDSKPSLFIEISLLASRPSNITTNSNRSQQNRVRGAATSIIAHIAKQCLQQQEISGIALIPSESSFEFYKKIGFTNPSKPFSDSWDELYVVLEKQQINLLFNDPESRLSKAIYCNPKMKV